MEQPGVVAGNFAPTVSLSFLSIFVHILGSIQLHVRSRGKAEAHHSRLQAVTGGTGVNGVICKTAVIISFHYTYHF